ncbi:site-specific DNA-methyltransferase [Neofamilia massiliensis]|uniref:site-specific DNA-methyltransferase n=1 Tax=Neofamilia massiliensis TaxID=1673724 RepID=UPI0006BB96A0|nr:site-specific DNA-methyltransferase [Neofamilia massiliensis]
MDKLKMLSKNTSDENFKIISNLFPGLITEKVTGYEDDGTPIIEKVIDVDLLNKEISERIVSNNEQRFQFTWPEKIKNIVETNTPIFKTLRPSKEESVNFNKTKNLYLEGDNIEVLKMLQESYLNKIDVIYVDPPYNTGTDILYINDYSDNEDEFGEKYEVDSEGNRLYTNTDTNGRFHTNWLNMIYPRIKLSRNLLSDEGFFLIAIDHNELANLIQVCDEVFGFRNRIAIITVVHKPEGRNQAKFIGPSNEFMLVYAKNESTAKLQKVVLDEEQKKAFGCKDRQGAYRLKNFIRLSDGKYATKESKPNFWYPIYVSPDLKELTLTKKKNYEAVYPVTDTGVERTWKTTSDTFLDRYKEGNIIAKEDNGKIRIFEKLRENQVIRTHWIEKKYHGYHYGTKLLDDLLETKTFDFPKSLYLMRDIVKLFCPKEGIIFDYFSGSSTTAHATMMVNAEDGGNRKFIMSQIPAECDKKSDAYKAGYENICEIGKERIRRAGQKILEDNKDKESIEDLDIGFRVLKTDSSNMKDVYYKPEEISQNFLDTLEDNIKADRSGEDLLFQVMLDLGISLSAKIDLENIDGKEVYIVDDGHLIACFDKDIDDDLVTKLAKKEPVFVVFRDSSMKSDSSLNNFDQIFKRLSPETTRKVI